MKSLQQLEAQIKHEKKAVLIVNTHSRLGSDLYDHALKMLAGAGYNLTASFRIDDLSTMGKIFTNAMSYKPSLLIVGSGDGTISEIVDHLAYQDTALGFIPLGTTNNFARSIGIPLDTDAAIQNIIEGKVADIDLGKINDDYFANVASIGISADVASNISDKLKKRFGRIAYTLNAIKALISHQYFHITVSSAGMKQTFYTHQLVIANGRSHGGRVIAQDANIDSHELVIFRVGGQGKLPLIMSTLRNVLSTKRTITQKSFTTATAVTIDAKPTQNIEVDGEIKAKTPATFSIAKEALRVMVPQSFEDV